MSHPVVTVQPLRDDEEAMTLPRPAVFDAPVRRDIVHFVQYNMAKNSRQAHGVAHHAGEIISAVSWGTGRARARVARVNGSGTRRAGEGAFGNHCRGGRMFAPLKTYRNWHVKLNLKMKRFAVCSAIAASSVQGLVKGRGHLVEKIPETILVVSDHLESAQRTNEAVALLEKVGALDDVLKIKESKNVRAGKGKMRGRRFRRRRGPLIVYNEDQGVVRACKNLGVELCHVERLNLLQLAPGGHLGRLIIWTKSAFERLDQIFGTFTEDSLQKAGWRLPQNIVKNADLKGLITSDEIQSVLRPRAQLRSMHKIKRNPLRNREAMVKLNPYKTKWARKLTQA